MRSAVVVAALLHSGLLLTATGLGKLLAPVLFRIELRRQAIVPKRLAGITAAGVPTVELTVGLWLLSGVAARFALLAAAGCLLAFAGYNALLVVRRRPLGCGCTGLWRVDASSHAVALVATLISCGIAAGSAFLAPAGNAYPLPLSTVIVVAAAAAVVVSVRRMRVA